MRSPRASMLTALGAAIAFTATTIPLGGVLQGATGSAPQAAVVVAASPSPGPAGRLELSTTSVEGIVTWEDAGLTQRFSEAQQCRIVQAPGAPDLLTLSGRTGSLTGTAGFRNGNIGVYEVDPEGDGASNAAQCSSVDAGSFTTTETLTLMVGSDAVTEFDEQLVASEATISIVAKSKSGRIEATLVDEDGDAVIGGGRTITWGPPGGKNLKVDEAISVGGAFTLSGETFSGLSLKALSGGFSLRGATFDLRSGYDGVLDCGQATETLAGSGLNPEVTVTRLGNADAAEPCELIPYTLRNSGEEVQFLKPLEQQTTAQFILDIVWSVSPANTGDTESPLLPDTYIDYELPGDLGEIALRWCPDVTPIDGYRIVDDVLNNPAAVDQVPESVLEGKQFTCILSQDSAVSDGDPGDVVTVTQRLYLLGDARMLMR